MDAQLYSIFCDVFRLKPGTPVDEWSMDSIADWDSLKHMHLIGSIEKKLEIELTFEEIVAMRSFSAIKHLLTEKGLS